jgi:hypothetical protein
MKEKSTVSLESTGMAARLVNRRPDANEFRLYQLDQWCCATVKAP